MGIGKTNDPNNDGTAAVITIDAIPNGRIEIEMLAWSYDESPTGGNLKIESPSGTKIFEIDITAAGPGFIPFSGSCLRGAESGAMIITLASGGGTVDGLINVIQRQS